MRNIFRVWLQPMDFRYLVSVDGEDNAHWLLRELAEFFIFRSEPLQAGESSSLFTFEVPCNGLLTYSRFQRLLMGIPQVALLTANVPR